MSFLGSQARGKGCVCPGVLSCPWQETLPLGVLSEALIFLERQEPQEICSTAPGGANPATGLWEQQQCPWDTENSVAFLEQVQGSRAPLSLQSKCKMHLQVGVSLRFWSPSIWSCLPEDNSWPRFLPVFCFSKGCLAVQCVGDTSTWKTKPEIPLVRATTTSFKLFSEAESLKVSLSCGISPSHTFTAHTWAQEMTAASPECQTSHQQWDQELWQLCKEW